MWQIYALVSLFLMAAEEIVDKAAIFVNLTIDSFAATFYRNFAYFLFAAIVGMTGILGPLSFVYGWPIIFVGLLGVGSSIFYTYLLKHIELSGISALDYSRPIVFLFIDVVVLKMALSGFQIGGVLLLVCGGLLFIISPVTKRLKPEYNRYVWGIFIFNTICYIAEFYIFKYYVRTQNLNEVSYIFSSYVIIAAGLFLVMLWKSNWKIAVNMVMHDRYIPRVVVAKGFDFAYSILWYKALRLTSVSQVSAIEAFYPLILVVFLYIAQTNFKYKMGERFDRRNLVQKMIGVAVLVIGIWLSS